MHSKLVRSICVALPLWMASVSGSLLAADWPRWLGPKGDNIAPDDGFEPDLSRWKTAWKASVGLGYSSVIVGGTRAFTLGHDGKNQETVFCFDAASGEVVWKFPYDAQLMPKMHPGGPNASPTIIGDRVITVSKDGQVYCLSADKGSKLWQANLVEVMGIKMPSWGFASSAVIYKDQVLLSAGKVAALDLQTGKTLWTSPAANLPGYTTPVVFAQGGKDRIAALDGKGLSILNAQDGGEVARRPFKSQFDVTAPTPVVLADGKRIFVGGNLSSEMLAFDGQQLTVVWTSTELKNAMNNSIVSAGAIYGIDGRQESAQARFVSLNEESGKVNWAKVGFGYGYAIGVGKNLLALTEGGELVVIKASPASYAEVSRLQVLGKKCWTTPVFANGRIYARNDAGDVVCLAKP